MEKNYKFYTNTKCEYFPCHKGIDKENFNCLFCFCPLYALGSKCGGNYKYFNGIKDCSQCLIPHQKSNYEHIVKKLNDVIEKVKIENNNS